MTKKIGIALSGGGYRATLYSLGSLIRLNELGILKQTSRITSVSGGSITAGTLAMHWPELQANEFDGAFFKKFVTDYIWDFCSENFDKKTVIRGLFTSFKPVSHAIEKKFSADLFRNIQLSDIALMPDAPQFLFYGTNIQTGSAVRIVDGILYDWKIGAVEIPSWTLAKVVGISSAFPPFLAPVKVTVDHLQWQAAYYQKLYSNIKYKKELVLADGGIYDNMGIESLWKKSSKKIQDKAHPFHSILEDDIDICLVSDAGAPLKFNPKIKKDWLSLSTRALDITIDQARAARKRWLIEKYKSNQLEGCYWGVGTNIDDYHLASSMTKDSTDSDALQYIDTRLKELSDKHKGQLINWGYALADTAIRKLCPQIIKVQTAPRWPITKFPL